MRKTILITGSTDGIGRMAAGLLLEQGHEVLLHGRSADKLATATAELSEAADRPVQGFLADLSVMAEVEALAHKVSQRHPRLDVLVNNAGVYQAPVVRTADGLDVRFAVNTLAPYLLTRRLLPTIPASGRIVNLSSAAQSTVDPVALRGTTTLGAGAAYAQSKLAITMWSAHLARELGPEGPVVVSVNPASMLGTNMVREAFGVSGGDVTIGAEIVAEAATGASFAAATGRYYDNDRGRFGEPHPDARSARKNADIARQLDEVCARLAG